MRRTYVPGTGYVVVADDLWVPKRWVPLQVGFAWPPRSVKRALPVAQRLHDSRRRRRARQVLIRAAARYGLRLVRR